jgi:hypothetical protein
MRDDHQAPLVIMGKYEKTDNEIAAIMTTHP